MTPTRHPLALLSGILLAATAAACSGGGGGGGSLAGDWQYLSGTVVADAGLTYASYLELSPGGSGTLFTASPLSQVPGCAALSYSSLPSGLLELTIPSLGYIASLDTWVYREGLDGDTLTLIDVYGNVATFQRAASIPAGALCPAAPVTRTLPFPSDRQPLWSYLNGMGSDGTSLWWSAANFTVSAFSPQAATTGALLSVAGAGGFFLLQTVQGNDFWLTNYTGANSAMARVNTAGSVVTSFDLYPTDPIGITAAAFDGTHLWIGGNVAASTGAPDELLKLDATVSPPAILARIPLDVPVLAMDFHSGSLWVEAFYDGTEVLRLGTDGAIQAVYRFPDGPRYLGLSELGGKLYTIQSDLQGVNGALVEMGL